MTKLFALLLLCGTSAADPSPTLSLGFDLTSGTDTRHYGMKLVDKACGNVEAKSRSSEDEIKVCIKSDTPKATRLAIDWHTHEGDREVRNRSTVLVARGNSVDLDSPGVKLRVSVQ